MKAQLVSSILLLIMLLTRVTLTRVANAHDALMQQLYPPKPLKSNVLDGLDLLRQFNSLKILKEKLQNHYK